MKSFSGKICLLGGFCFSAGALVAALYFQISKEWYPCALCILQRYAYMASALGFLGLLLAGQAKLTATVLKAFTVAAIGAGFAMAGYHVWVLANPSQSCGVDPLQLSLNSLPWVSFWPDMFMADGLCSDEYPPLLGLSFPAWSAVGFAGLGLLFLFAILSRKGFRN